MAVRHARAGDGGRGAGAARAVARRAVRRLHGRARRAQPRAARGRRDARARPRSRSDALALARESLAAFGDRVELVHADYRELRRVLDARGIDAHRRRARRPRRVVDAVRRRGRGFSFRRDEPLDMRMDRARARRPPTCCATSTKTSWPNVIFQFGEERYSRRDRAGDRRRRGASAPIDDDRAARARSSGARSRARVPADRSGDADVPGAADLGQPRARRARRVPRRRGAAAARRARGWR